MVRVEIDDEQSNVMGAEPGVRYWIEVSKGGQIINVIERTADQFGSLGITVQDLATQFADVHTSDFEDFPKAKLPKASVVVPTVYHRVDLLRRTVESLLNLDYPDFEIIVVDNRVGLDHVPIPEFTNDGRVKIVLEGTPGASAARNRGFAESHGELIAPPADHVEGDRQWLRAGGVVFARDASIDAIGGIVRPSELDTEPQLWFEEFYGGFTRSYQATEWSLELVDKSDALFPYSAGHFGAGCNIAFRRSTFERIGGFDVRLGPGTSAKSAEDLKILLDLILTGGKIARVPSALVRHSHRRTANQFMKQVYCYGVGFTAMFTCLVIEHPRHLGQILKRVPIGMRYMLAPNEPRSPSSKNSYPRRTQFIQLLGMVYGPLAYLLSATKVRMSGRHK